MPQSPARPSVAALEKRLEHVESEVRNHKADDLNQFGQLRKDIAVLGETLGQRIDDMAERFQRQIDGFTLDKVKAEGRAEGIASVVAANASPKWWHPILRAAIILLLTTIVGLIGWMGSTIVSLEQEKLTQSRPPTSVTVNPPSVVQPVVPQQMIPPTAPPATPDPAD